MIDVKQQISDVRRWVGNRTLEAGEARVLTISQVYGRDLQPEEARAVIAAAGFDAP